MKIKIKDIAEKLGISASTVSVVLNNRPSRISEKTRLKILNMAGKLNYNKDIPVDVEDKINIKSTAIITNELRENIDLTSILSQKLSKLGYTAFILESKNTDILSILDNVLSKGIDEIIILEPSETDILKEYFEIFTIPNVIYSKKIIDTAFNSVCVLNKDINYDMVSNKLIEIVRDFKKDRIKNLIIE